MIQRPVVRHAVEPGTEAALAAKARQPVVGAQKRLLDHVLGVVGPLGAEDRQHQAHHAVPVADNQLVEVPQVTGIEIPPDQLGVTAGRSHAHPYSELAGRGASSA